MDKEKATKDLSVKVQPSLYEKFGKQCNANYRSVSDVIREFMASYALGLNPLVDELSKASERMAELAKPSPLAKLLEDTKKIGERLQNMAQPSLEWTECTKQLMKALGRIQEQIDATGQGGKCSG